MSPGNRRLRRLRCRSCVDAALRYDRRSDERRHRPPSRHGRTPADAPRLREIPYNYTSFSDREIVIRLLGAPMWQLLDGAARRAPHRPLGADAVRGAGRHLGRRAQSVPAGRPARQSARGALLVDALRHRLREIDKRRARATRRRRRARREGRRSWSPPRARRSTASPRAFRETRELRKRARARSARYTRRGQHRVRRPRARVARDRCDRLARRVSVRRAVSGHRGRGARPRRRLHRARPHDHSARRRHRLHRRRDSARRALGGDQHREARAADRASSRIVLPGHATPTPTIDCGAGVVTQRAMDAAERAGLVFACDPTSADASCIGGNVAMNAGGKKAVLWGTALDNLASWRMVTPDARVARGHAPRPQPRQDPRRRAGDVRAARGSATTARRVTRTRDADDSRRDVPQGGPRQGRHRQVPRRPARRAEGRLRRHHRQRALHPAPDAAGDPHRVPRVLRPGARFDAGDRRDQGLSRRAAQGRRRARACSPASSISTSAT